MKRSALLAALLLATSSEAEMWSDPAGPQEAVASAAIADPGSCPDYNPRKNPYFGDLHVHTAFSLDALIFGTRKGPTAAYLFAQGQPIELAGGGTAQLDRPLDFMAVTDHGESLIRNMWQRSQNATERAHSPCEFTTFKGYEWTQRGENIPGNLHRNVIFAGSEVPAAPLDSISHPTPEELWAGLEAECQAPACDVIAIPHNSNQSMGIKFDVAGYTPEVAQRRARIEVLAEVFQGKGSSECLNFADPADDGYDPYCSFELLPATTQPEDAPGYVRYGLGNGLSYYANTGINPVQVGLIASTDTHNATGGNVAEDKWPGHHARLDNTPAKRLSGYNNPGGLAVVWAEENTRRAIFSALRRRETYATSGTRMTVRYYQTWDHDHPCSDPDALRDLIENGVPMGGTMSASDPGSHPTFVVLAAKDEANLSAIHIVKGSLVAGEVQNRLVVLPAANPDIGAPVLCRTWSDTEYDPTAPAFYYARVLEVPTPRWSHYDCERDPETCDELGRDRLDIDIQERAWTSPIWYLPQ